MELKRNIELKRRAIMETINNDIKSQLKKLMVEGINEEQKQEIERKIEEDKAKLKCLLKEEQTSKMKEREEKKQQIMMYQKKKEEMNKPIELILFDIGSKQQFDSLIKALRVCLTLYKQLLLEIWKSDRL